MPLEILILLVVVMLLFSLSVLKAEKIIKITLGTYLLLPFSMGLGEVLLQLSLYLSTHADQSFLWISFANLSLFLSNAQPTIVLLLFVLLVWFISKNSYLSVAVSSDPFQKQLQTLVRSALALASFLSYLYFSLAYFKWEVFNYLFVQTAAISSYTIWFPLFGFLTALVVVLASSHIQIKLFRKKAPELE